MDARIRRLERAASDGDPANLRRLCRERVRVGQFANPELAEAPTREVNSSGGGGSGYGSGGGSGSE